jgi:hypothetical protein
MSDGIFGFLRRLAPDAGRAASVSADAKGTVRKKAKQKCKRQRGPCERVLIPLCGDNLGCELEVQRCCSLLGACDATGFLTCAGEVEI